MLKGKKIFYFLLAIIVLFSIACTPQGEVPQEKPDINQEDKDMSKYTIKDYYPFEANTYRKYQGVGNEYAGYETYVDFLREDMIQIRSITGGTTVGKVLQYKDGELVLLKSQEEFYYRDDLTVHKEGAGEVLLKEPLVVGTTWTLEDGRKRSITGVNLPIEVPLGKYEALEVTTEGKDGKTRDYYVLKIGLVKSIYTGEDFEVSSSLEVKDTNAVYEAPIKIYYPSDNGSGVVLSQVDKKMSFKTNDKLKDYLAEYFRTPPKDQGALLSKNAKLNYVFLDVPGQAAHIDFSKEFITEMNAGSAWESGILQSIVNTVGAYYNVEKVHLTIEEESYSSGHIAMEEDQPFLVEK